MSCFWVINIIDTSVINTSALKFITSPGVSYMMRYIFTNVALFINMCLKNVGQLTCRKNYTTF